MIGPPCARFQKGDYFMYDLDGVYKRCGHKLQEEYKITAEEFQAARKIGRKEILREVLEWIENHRKNYEHSAMSGHGRHSETAQQTRPKAENKETEVIFVMQVHVPSSRSAFFLNMMKSNNFKTEMG
jgi:hypothetical protein